MALCQVHAQQAPGQKDNSLAGQYQQLAWLAGTWTRLHMKADRTAHERWEKTGENTLAGWGVTLKEKDTLFVEKLQLVVKDNSIWYVADVSENKGPVWFRLTNITPDGFTCENPAHDFPQKITYQREGDKLLATISGNGRAMAFNFVRQP